MSGPSNIDPTNADPNPCPFLRALVSRGAISGEREPLGHLSSTIASVFTDPKKTPVITAAVYQLALTGSGMHPRQILQNKTKGLAVSSLREGPLDKRGVGSRILDQTGRADVKQIDRLDEFASDYRSPDGGTTERLNAEQLVTFMDANFERGKPDRRRIDRKLMDGEWPVLLEVMGKESPDGLYLSLAEVRTLVVERQLPDRVTGLLHSA